MTTATAPARSHRKSSVSRPTTAPTEAEIREVVKAALDESDIDVGAWLSELARPIAYHPTNDQGGSPDCLWTNLRPTEADRLSDLLESIYEDADRLEAEIVARLTDRIVAAGLTFGQEYPEAPRTDRKQASA